MMLLAALLLATATPAPACEITAPNAAALCADKDVQAARARFDAAYAAWEKADPRKATIRAQRDRALAEYRKGYADWATNGATELDPQFVSQMLLDAAQDADEQARAAAMLTRADAAKVAVDGCAAIRTGGSCRVMASGMLYSDPYPEDGVASRAVQWVQLELRGEDLPMRQMTIAWDITEPKRRALIGYIYGEIQAEAPTLLADGPADDRMLLLPAVRNGTGAQNADALFAVKAAGATTDWRNIDIDSWKDDLATRVPKGLGVWKGVEYRWGGRWAQFELYRDSDANCCATGGKGTAMLQLQGDRLAIEETDFTISAGTRPLTCKATEAVYEFPGTPGITARFVQPKIPPQAYGSQLIMVVSDANGAQRFYGFNSAQGWGGNSLVRLDGLGGDEEGADVYGGAEAAERQNDPATADPPNPYYGFRAKGTGLVQDASPPQVDDAPPEAIFIPRVSWSLWYDGGTGKGGSKEWRIDMPADLMYGRCDFGGGE